MKNGEDAEEVAQDVLQKVGALRNGAALSSWIYRIVSNAAMSRLPGGWRWPPTPAKQFPRSRCRLVTPTRRGAAEGRAARRGDQSGAIEALPDICLEPAVRRDIQMLAMQEASSRLRFKDQRLHSRLHRGQLMLRARLRSSSGGLSLHPLTPAFS